MPSHEWVYVRNTMLGTSETVGPVPEPELIDLVKQGKLKRDASLCSSTRTNGAWLQLQQIPGLLKALEMGELERQEERQRQVNEREAERLAREAERQRQVEVRRVEAQRQATEAEQVIAASRQRHEQENAARQAMFRPREYPAMQIIIVLLYVAAAILVCSFLFHVVVVCLAFASSAGSEGLGLVMSAGLLGLFISFIFHGILVVGFVASAESIRVVIDIQQNTQETAFFANIVAANSVKATAMAAQRLS